MPTPEDIQKVQAIAAEFDLKRDCSWNSMLELACEDRFTEVFTAADIPEFSSLGGQCHGTLLELALCHTLRPCKDCGGDILFKGTHTISCCACLADGCDECCDPEDGACPNFADNHNLPDAITRWNLRCAKTDVPAGLVEVCG